VVIAEEFGVTDSAVDRWRAAREEGGAEEALRSIGRPSYRALPDEQQVAALVVELDRGALAHGYDRTGGRSQESMVCSTNCSRCATAMLLASFRLQTSRTAAEAALYGRPGCLVHRGRPRATCGVPATYGGDSTYTKRQAPRVLR
jgi:hypothetical protein